VLSGLFNYLEGLRGLAPFKFFKKMALYYDLKVFKDVYQLILKIFEYTKDFPREYKYTLVQDMKRDAIVLVRSIYRANKAKSKVRVKEETSKLFKGVLE